MPDVGMFMTRKTIGSFPSLSGKGTIEIATGGNTRPRSPTRRSAARSETIYTPPPVYGEPQPIHSKESPVIPFPLPHRRNFLLPGVYEIKNDALGWNVELTKNGRAVGRHRDGCDNQRWSFERLGGGWSIQNKRNGYYLTISDPDAKPGVKVVATQFPPAWDVKVDWGSSGQYKVRICWPYSRAVWDMKNGGDGTVVELGDGSAPRDEPDCKLWQLTSVRSTALSADSDSGSSSASYYMVIKLKRVTRERKVQRKPKKLKHIKQTVRGPRVTTGDFVGGVMVPGDMRTSPGS